jgi:hypothetical protein
VFGLMPRLLKPAGQGGWKLGVNKKSHSKTL